MISSLMLIIALCMDSFLVSLAYGIKNIHIPMRSIWLITSIETIVLGISFYGATKLYTVMNDEMCKYISAIIFLIIGISSIFQSTIKQYIRHHKGSIKIHFKEISIVFDIIMDETKADLDHSKELSMKEASYLAFALSFDSLISGFAYGIQPTTIFLVLLLNLGIGFIAIYAGFCVGHYYKKIGNCNFTWLSGVLFLFIAIMRFLK